MVKIERKTFSYLTVLQNPSTNMFIISLQLDGFERKAANFGFAFKSDLPKIINVVEEAVEIGIPIMCVVAMMNCFNKSIPDEDFSK